MPIKSKGLHEAIDKVTDRNAPNGAWVIADVIGMGERFDLYDEGEGVESLRDNLPLDNVCFVLISLRTTIDGTPNIPRVIFLHWKGPKCKGMKIARSNQLTQMAWDVMKPHHGHLEVLGTSEITVENLLGKLDPKGGSHVVA